jgi:hypothetical protein
LNNILNNFINSVSFNLHSLKDNNNLESKKKYEAKIAYKIIATSRAMTK